MPIMNFTKIQLTLNDILTNPTGKKTAYVANRAAIKEDLERKYYKLMKKVNNKLSYKIYKEGVDYYFHFKIPSSTYDGLFYDVVLQFYPEDKKMSQDKTISRYYVNIFSNSPSFMFTYTYVVYHNNMLPKGFKKYCSKEALRNHPTTRNPVEVYGYEKSVYFACLYIIINKLYNKFQIERSLFRFNNKTFDDTIMTQENKLVEYNRTKEKERRNIANNKRKAIQERNKSIVRKKKRSSSSTKRKKPIKKKKK